MPIVVPSQRNIVTSSDDEYVLPLSILQEQLLTSEDEEIMQALARHVPNTKIRAGDFVLLRTVPEWLSKNRRVVPRCWKVRFVISQYAWNLIRVVDLYGGKLGIDRAIALMEGNRNTSLREYRKPMIYAHGYPHGKYPNSAAWLPEDRLQRTIHAEDPMEWVEIVESAHAPYAGFDTEKFNTRFILDFEPDHYADGRNIGRPFDPEEPLVNTLYFGGLEEMMEIPFIFDGQPVSRQPRGIDQDHDIFVDEDDE